MILVTVGTQLPFDRLIEAVDNIVPIVGEPTFAQIGHTNYRPKHLKFSAFLDPAEFEERVRQARVIVSHAGIGSILTAQKYQKPIVLFPREARHGEHRNDHQLATCRGLALRTGIYMARNSDELLSILSNSLVPTTFDSSSENITGLISGLSKYFVQNRRRRRRSHRMAPIAESS